MSPSIHKLELDIVRIAKRLSGLCIVAVCSSHRSLLFHMDLSGVLYHSRYNVPKPDLYAGIDT